MTASVLPDYLAAGVREVATQVPELLVIGLLASWKLGLKAYDKVMAAWWTSCPRLLVWENAVDLRFVRLELKHVVLTEAGWDRLASGS